MTWISLSSSKAKLSCLCEWPSCARNSWSKWSWKKPFCRLNDKSFISGMIFSDWSRGERWTASGLCVAYRKANALVVPPTVPKSPHPLNSLRFMQTSRTHSGMEPPMPSSSTNAHGWSRKATWSARLGRCGDLKADVLKAITLAMVKSGESQSEVIAP
eukprot:5418686-Heterocapsa_arctica.AAC.1